MNALELVVGAIATWRITHILLFEHGPFKVFERVRSALGVIRYPDDGSLASYKYEITICIWCLSVWIGLAITLLYWWFGPLFTYWLSPFVFSAFAAAFDRVLNKAK